MKLKAAGSNRQYSRITLPDGTSAIRCQGVSQTENHAFITMARHFEQLGLPTPRLYGVSEDEMTYDQQDLGDIVLYDLIAADRADSTLTDVTRAYLINTMRALRAIHDRAAEGFDFSVCYPVPAMDKRSILWDLNYYKYCYLKVSGVEIDEEALEDDFERLTAAILAAPQDSLILRDCQSRNVMICEGKPYFIDFQGGRRGNRCYDLASFLWQARAGFSDEEREMMLSAYIDAIDAKNATDATVATEIRQHLPTFVLFRTLQVLGAYGFRGLIERKDAFLGQIPKAIENMRQVLSGEAMQARYPYLTKLASLA